MTSLFLRLVGCWVSSWDFDSFVCQDCCCVVSFDLFSNVEITSCIQKPLPDLIHVFSLYQVQKLDRDVEEDLKGWRERGGREKKIKTKEGSHSEPTIRRKTRKYRKTLKKTIKPVKKNLHKHSLHFKGGDLTQPKGSTHGAVFKYLKFYSQKKKYVLKVIFFVKLGYSQLLCFCVLCPFSYD